MALPSLLAIFMIKTLITTLNTIIYYYLNTITVLLSIDIEGGLGLSLVTKRVLSWVSRGLDGHLRRTYLAAPRGV